MLQSSNSPLQYEVEVGEQGQVNLKVPFNTGQKITVLVMQSQPESTQDLVAAASSSLAFWDNAIDDAEWNNA
jgi:hypothetical protein